MKISIKKTKAALFLLSIIGLTACNHAAIRKTESEVTSPEVILETDVKDDIIIPVTIKNKKYNFLVNTGVSINVIDEKLVDIISSPYLFSDLPSSYKESLSDQGRINGSQEKYVKAQPFFIGNQEIKDEDFWFSFDLSSLTKEYGINIDGMIGMESFRKFSWQVDNTKKRLTITKDAPSVFSYSSCAGYSNQPYSMPEISLQYDEANDVSFQIKTGTSASDIGIVFFNYLTENKKEKLEHFDNAIVLSKKGIASTSSYYILKKMSFNNMLIGDMPVVVNEENQYHLGMDFLSRFTKYAFIPSKMMFCFNAQSIKYNYQTPVRYININYINGRLELFKNTDDTLSDTGLKNGDAILIANNKKYESHQISELRGVLTSTPKGELKLIIKRGKQQLELQL